jgi:hypothetical protein
MMCSFYEGHDGVLRAFFAAFISSKKQFQTRHSAAQKNQVAARRLAKEDYRAE